MITLWIMEISFMNKIFLGNMIQFRINHPDLEVIKSGFTYMFHISVIFSNKTLLTNVTSLANVYGITLFWWSF